MNESFSQLLASIASKSLTSLSFLLILIGLFNYKKLDKAMRYFLFHLITADAINLFEQLLIWACIHYPSFFQYINTNWGIEDTFFLNIFLRLATYFWGGLFFNLILPKPINQWVKSLSIFLIFAAILICVYIDGFYTSGKVNLIVVQFFITISSFIYIRNSLHSHLYSSLLGNKYFYICLGLLFGSLVGFILLFFADTIQKNNYSYFNIIIFVRNTVSIIPLLCYCMSFYLSIKQSKID